MSESDLSINDLLRLFRYDEAEGALYWNTRPAQDFAAERQMHTWNTKFAGKKAGYVNKQNSRRVVRILLHGVSANYLAYRIIWAIHYGRWPSNTIDHIDGDQANDRLANLRDVPFSENCKNLAIACNNRSGCRGVSWDNVKHLWQSRIQVDMREIWLGYFETKAAAIEARRKAEKEYGFHANHGRASRVPVEKKKAA